MSTDTPQIDLAKLYLREATIQDSDLLLNWRNDITTRRASMNRDIISNVKHRSWLEKNLASDTSKIYMVEHERNSVATVRYDIEKGIYWLSWTVSPEYRQLGIGKRSVAMLIEQVGRPVKARVRAENDASCRIAENNGLRLIEQSNGIRTYGLPSKSD